MFSPLGISLFGLIAGSILHWVGFGTWRNLLWAIVAGSGIAMSLSSIVTGLLEGRLGVDIVALLAAAGAIAVGEYLAGAVISVMLASGQGWRSDICPMTCRGSGHPRDPRSEPDLWLDQSEAE